MDKAPTFIGIDVSKRRLDMVTSTLVVEIR
jgi:hypothetical protein